MKGPQHASDLPEGHNLTGRPVEERRDLPIPAVNVHLEEAVAMARPDGDYSSLVVDISDPEAFPKFDAIYAPAVFTLAREGKCGLCAKRMAVCAFIGGQDTLDHSLYSDPPMHGECALAAMTLCPHLRMRRHRRTSETRKMHEAGEIFVHERGDKMYVVIARTFEILLAPDDLRFRVPLEHRLGVEEFQYIDGEIERVSTMGLRLDQLPEGL